MMVVDYLAKQGPLKRGQGGMGVAVAFVRLILFNSLNEPRITG